MLINGKGKVGIKTLKNLEALTDYSKTNDGAYQGENIIQQGKIVFDDMIADMESNKTLSPTVTELFLRRRNLNI